MSRPPWLTAILLWPKGDAWGGGGLFEGAREVADLTGLAFELRVAPPEAQRW